MKLAVVILNWNASEETLSCVANLRRWSGLQPILVVVDNNSREEERRKLRSLPGEVLLIQNGENLGFSGGSNVGIRAALKKKAEAVLLLNNDAVIEEKDVSQMTGSLADNPDIAVIGPLLYDGDTGRLVNAGGRDIAWHYHTHLQEPQDPQEIYDVDYVSGTAMLVKSDVFSSVGMLDERYFFSGEIADFCKRIRSENTDGKRNSRVVIDPLSKAAHHLHNPSKDREKLYAYYTIRNRYLYVRKFYKGLRLLLYPVWVYRHFRHALSTLLQNRLDVTQVILKGVFDGMAGKTGRMVA